VGGHRVRIDHGRDRVGGIVEAVDELEAERDQQGDKEQQERQISRYLGAGRVDIGIDAVGDVQQGGSDHPHSKAGRRNGC
jgi:hypothetical protein